MLIFSGGINCGMESALQTRVKERMDALGLNPFETAKRANLGASYVRDILRGKTRMPNAENIAKLAAVLATTADYLMDRSNESTLRPVAAKVEGSLRSLELTGNKSPESRPACDPVHCHTPRRNQ